VASADDWAMLHRPKWATRVSSDSFGVIIDHAANKVVLPNALYKAAVDAGYKVILARYGSPSSDREWTDALHLGKQSHVQYAADTGIVKVLDGMANHILRTLPDDVNVRGHAVRYANTKTLDAMAKLLYAATAAGRVNSSADLSSADSSSILPAVEKEFSKLDADFQQSIADLVSGDSIATSSDEITVSWSAPGWRQEYYTDAIQVQQAYKYLGHSTNTLRFSAIQNAAAQVFVEQREEMAAYNQVRPYIGTNPGQYMNDALSFLSAAQVQTKEYGAALKNLTWYAVRLAGGHKTEYPGFDYNDVGYVAPISFINQALNNQLGIYGPAWYIKDHENKDLARTNFWKAVHSAQVESFIAQKELLYDLQVGYQQALAAKWEYDSAQRGADVLNLIFCIFAGLGYGVYLPGASLALGIHIAADAGAAAAKTAAESAKWAGAVLSTVSAFGGVAYAKQALQASSLFDFKDMGEISQKFGSSFGALQMNHAARLPEFLRADYIEKSNDIKKTQMELLDRTQKFMLSFGEGANYRDQDDMFGWRRKSGFDTGFFTLDDDDQMGQLQYYLEDALISSGWGDQMDDRWRAEAEALGFDDVYELSARTVSLPVQHINNFEGHKTTLHGLNISLWYTNSNLWHFTINDGYVVL
jgi:hypothetical protein